MSLWLSLIVIGSGVDGDNAVAGAGSGSALGVNAMSLTSSRMQTLEVTSAVIETKVAEREREPVRGSSLGGSDAFGGRARHR
mgnify:CR=1 FL=1